MRPGNRLSAVPLGFCLAWAAVAGHAQTLISPPVAPLSTREIPLAEQARDTMNRYAECIVRTRGTAARRALSQPTDAAVYGELRKIASPDCISGGTLGMPPELFRGAIYRALYIRDFGREAELPASDVTLSASEDPVRTFGDCVAKLAPAETQEFILGRPATSEEQAAIVKLGPTLSQCVAPGDQVKFSKAVLQGALAEALYKRSVASAALAELAEAK